MRYKAKLQFDMRDGEDVSAFHRAINADKVLSILWDIAHTVRKELKYTENLEDSREEFQNILRDIEESNVFEYYT